MLQRMFDCLETLLLNPFNQHNCVFSLQSIEVLLYQRRSLDSGGRFYCTFCLGF
jgi:hypothetical protein